MSLGPPLNHGNQNLRGWGQACVVLKTPQGILISSLAETHELIFYDKPVVWGQQLQQHRGLAGNAFSWPR